MLYEIYLRGIKIFPTLIMFKTVIFCFMLIGFIILIAKILKEKADFTVYGKAVATVALLVGILGYSLTSDMINRSLFTKGFDKFIPQYKGKHYYSQVKDLDIADKITIMKNLYANEYNPKVAPVRTKILTFLNNSQIKYSNEDVDTIAMLAVDTNIKAGIREGKYKVNKKFKGVNDTICHNVLNATKQCGQYLTY